MVNVRKRGQTPEYIGIKIAKSSDWLSELREKYLRITSKILVLVTDASKVRIKFSHIAVFNPFTPHPNNVGYRTA